MKTWKQALREGLAMGTAASVLSTVVLAVAGRREAGSWAAPTNATSHWLWGDESLGTSHPSMRHTAAGYVIHHGTSVMWASLYAKACRERLAVETLAGDIAAGLAASAVACFVDYQLTPKRLTPGFEHRLSKGAMVGVYAAFGIGLGMASWAMRKR